MQTEFWKPQSATVLREVISRFVDETRRRGECHIEPRRRACRRYHRSWPLAVAVASGGRLADVTVALHNASSLGIAFLGPRHLDPGTTILLRLFWYDDDCPLVPAIVRHSTPTAMGYLVGCEFVVWDDSPEEEELL